MATRTPTSDFNNCTALVVGDIMLDHFFSGEASRISPEAPVPVLRINAKESMPGGAANTAANIAALGTQVQLIAPLGKDADGDNLRQLLGDISNVNLIEIPDDRATTVKSRYSALGQQLLRIDAEDLTPMDEALTSNLIGKALASCGSVDVVVLSDYAKGALTDRVCGAVIDAARAAGVPCIADPKGPDAAKYRGSTFITPNEAELAAICRCDAMTETELIANAGSLISAHNIDHVAVTRGKSGVMLVDTDGLLAHVPSFALDVFDVSGAGDSFVAGLACAMATGQSPDAAVNYANAVAGVAVGKSGTALVRPHEVERLLLERGRSERSVVTADYMELASIAEAWRREGYSIGFTNGVFDLLHLGHLRVLETARTACDKLIVAVNSDPSVKRLKGKGRPVQPATARAEILSSLQGVDLVVVFDEDTPIDAIEASAPDVLVKGGDYEAENVVGHRLVTERGGKVLIVPTLQGHSTTGTIGKMYSRDE